ncbi:glycerophosphodiester phosphodiesterase family protein [Holdemania massiliensis]|uniref:glycerophosphodiester phosphodiesterase family protein n=1 Tax=Holdemania massiliensis TaxID=1468449 RepID=UPI001F068009|nr:glycerophosphodiester phosphodiesterase family protein [Holdemania massiliensis]MCH1940234.1 hypothetical protein [Holdemania massiliensis]
MKKLFVVFVIVLAICALGGFGILIYQRILSAPADEVSKVDIPLKTPVPLIITSTPGELIEDWNHTYRVMAHALGGIENYDYTNSLEAFYQNYNAGTRLFEIDLDTTSDGDICLIHTWEDFRNKLTDIGGDWPMSTEEFKQAKIHGKYTTVMFKDLLKLMEEIPDFHIIIDSKTFDIEGSEVMYNRMMEEVNAVNPELVKRIVPQAYTPEMYDFLNENYDFDKIIFTLYHYYVDSDGQKIYEFVKDRKVPVVVMHMDNEWATKVITDIYAYAEMQGYEDEFTIYIHTVNKIDDALNIININHFFGVYSDFITEDKIGNIINR